ncbi:hypothetical protein HC766_04645 [Candidatus Gracilibacteria bacterium]|nr:hypothetical protein [Candidatus Gracilibacteria bacterium]
MNILPTPEYQPSGSVEDQILQGIEDILDQMELFRTDLEEIKLEIIQIQAQTKEKQLQGF